MDVDAAIGRADEIVLGRVPVVAKAIQHGAERALRRRHKNRVRVAVRAIGGDAPDVTAVQLIVDSEIAEPAILDDEIKTFVELDGLPARDAIHAERTALEARPHDVFLAGPVIGETAGRAVDADAIVGDLEADVAEFWTLYLLGAIGGNQFHAPRAGRGGAQINHRAAARRFRQTLRCAPELDAGCKRYGIGKMIESGRQKPCAT